MGDELQQRLTDLSDEEFELLYGPLARLRPDGAAGLLDGLEAPWWIAGGWAIEAFTHQPRPHEDVDVCVLARDVPVLVEHFLGTHHVWAAGSGLLQPILSPTQSRPERTDQIWIRKDASEPWLLDVVISPDRDGRWVFKRDPDVVEDLAAVTWTAADGISYQTPEIVLAFKAVLDRPKDTADLDATVPLLGPDATRWLADTIARLYPGHAWLQRLS